MLEVRSLYKSYGDEQVLHDLSMTIDTGKILVLLGPSGSGKTTLLKIIAGLNPPDSGAICLDGQLIEHEKLKWQARQALRFPSIGLVFQDLRLFPHMTCADNCLVGLNSEKDSERKVLEYSEALGVTAAMHRRPALISRGQAQRVAIIRALVRNQRLMLMDEPTASLDESSRGRVAALLKTHASQRGLSILIVTHDTRLAPLLGATQVELRDGRIKNNQHIDHEERRQ